MDNVKVIMRQTNYTKDEAEEALKQNNNNVIEVIEKYMEIQKSKWIFYF